MLTVHVTAAEPALIRVDWVDAQGTHHLERIELSVTAEGLAATVNGVVAGNDTESARLLLAIYRQTTALQTQMAAALRGRGLIA